MRNIHKTILAIFCGGVFLSGIGTGIAFYEFSSFAYAGEVLVGDVKMATKNLDYSFQLKEEQQLRIYGNYYFYRNSPEEVTIIPDETVPENTVRFQVTYNESAVKPRLNSYEDDSDDPYVGIEFYYLQDDWSIFMTAKDRLLEDIKNSRIGSYDTVSVEQIRIFVNPATEDLVVMD